jgi:predicted enzyme related to lactoylglutathione lyase
LKPQFQNERLATIVFGAFTLILDAAETDTVATIGFETDDCDRDFRAVVERGAVVLDPPGDRPWGSRAAYIQGPGALKFEIEQTPKEGG